VSSAQIAEHEEWPEEENKTGEESAILDTNHVG
jgi:hypothetical protein